MTKHAAGIIKPAFCQQTEISDAQTTTNCLIIIIQSYEETSMAQSTDPPAERAEALYCL